MWIDLFIFVLGTMFGLGIACLLHAASAADDALEREDARRLIEALLNREEVIE